MTKSERQVMELLWRSDHPLSCTEIVQLSTNKTWKDSYVHSIIKALMEKGIVEIAVFELASRGYARKFAPTMSKSEYAAKRMIEFLTPNEIREAIQILEQTVNSDERIQ